MGESFEHEDRVRASVVRALTIPVARGDFPQRVYFIRASTFAAGCLQQPIANHIKIGISYYPEQRMWGLQKATHSSLELLAQSPFLPSPRAQAIERSLHALFNGSHVRGEWFSPSDELESTIRQLDAASKFWLSVGVTK